MLTSFWEGLGGKLAERWAAIVTPALSFWIGGVAAWIWSHGGLSGWQRMEDLVTDRTPWQYAAIVVGGFLVILISVAALRRVTPSVGRLLEGYWPASLAKKPWNALVRRQRAKLTEAQTQFNELARNLAEGVATDRLQQVRYEQLERRLRRLPLTEDLVMPTRLGNIRRAAEGLPLEKYGLEPEKCLPRLWLVLPDGAKQELAKARSNLDAAISAWICGLLLLVWTIWTWWATPIAIVTTLSAYSFALSAAATYGDLVESAFDMHRKLLYESMRWPLPDSPAKEYEAGTAITDYLSRAGYSPAVTFSSDAEGPSTIIQLAQDLVDRGERLRAAEDRARFLEAALKKAEEDQFQAEQL